MTKIDLVKLPVGMEIYHGTDVENDFVYPRGPAWFTESLENAKDFGRNDDVRISAYRVKSSPTLLRFPTYEQLFDWLNTTYGQEIDYTYDAADFIYNQTDYDGWILDKAYQGGFNDYDPNGPYFSDIMICEPSNWLQPLGATVAQLLSVLADRLQYKIPIPDDIMAIKDAFVRNGYKLFVVGGAVRDALLGKKPKDYDLATDALPDEVERIAQEAGFKTLPTGKAFGIINVFTEAGEYEIATFREDIGSGRRPEGVKFTTIDEDVKRRDLTINALFYDIDTEEVVDLVGGIEDLRNKTIRTVGNPRDRFGEDRLRILRALRFAGRFGSGLDPEVDRALREDASLMGISGERIRDEFLEGIASAKSVHDFLSMVNRYDLFYWIFPDLTVDREVLEEDDLPSDPIVLLARLLKGNDPKLLIQKLNAAKYKDAEIKGISFLCRLIDLSPENAVALKKAESVSKVSNSQIKAFGKAEHINQRLLSAFLRFELTVTGPQIMEQYGLKPGKELGNMLQKLETENFNKLLGINAATAEALRPGTVVYHGTSSSTSFSVPKGPAWFTESPDLANEYAHHGTGKPKILSFTVKGSPKLMDENDVENLRTSLPDNLSIQELAREVCKLGEWDGWFIPGESGSGESDIMLCKPEKWLTPEVKQMTRNVMESGVKRMSMSIPIVRATVTYEEKPGFVLVNNLPPLVHSQLLKVMGHEALDIHDDSISFPYSKSNGVLSTLKMLGVNVDMHRRVHAKPTDDDPGIMICLYPPEDVASQYAVEGGEEADSMHVTLAYLGKLSELPENAYDLAVKACEKTAKNHSKMDGSIGGIGRWDTGDKDCVFATVDLPGSNELRTELVGHLDDLGVPAKSNHGWSAHMTIQYIDKDSVIKVNPSASVKVSFGSLWVVSNDKNRTEIKLRGSEESKEDKEEKVEAFNNVIQKRRIARDRWEDELNTILDNARDGHISDRNAMKVVEKTGLDPRKKEDYKKLRKTIPISPSSTVSSDFERKIMQRLGWW